MPKKSSSAVPAPFETPAPPAGGGARRKRRTDLPRVPPQIDGIQANTCRNAACRNFGVEPLPAVTIGRTRKGAQRVRDGYRIVGHNRVPGWRVLLCTYCGEQANLKSNKGIKEELDRIAAWLGPDPGPSCRTPTCGSHGKPVHRHPRLYYAHGRTRAGTPRWRCRECRRTIATKVFRRRSQPKSHENRTVFNALINKASIKAISRIAELSPQTVYDKIDFIHRQCVAFAAERERQMPNKDLGRRYVSVDRQDYIINWTDRKDRRPTQLTAVASADNQAGYIYGMHLNFDPDADLAKIEFEAIQAGDFDGRDPSYRRHARYWMEPDLGHHKDYEARNSKVIPDRGSVLRKVAARQEEIDGLADPEDRERLLQIVAKLPGRGVQVHFAYTVHAHFRLLARLLAGTKKVRFFMDQDETLRAGCLSAFAWRIKNAEVDAFYVRIDKDAGIDTRRFMVSESKKAFNLVRQALGKPDWTDHRVRLHLIRERLPNLRRKRGQRDAWLHFPEYTINEPDKAVAYLTNRGDYGLDHLAALYSRASMHAVDRYFMQIRRLLMMLERPITSKSNTGQVWRGYSPYNPTIIQKLLDIFRVHYNYCKPERLRRDKDGNPLPRRTPAMKLGLAKGQIRIEDILYFRT